MNPKPLSLLNHLTVPVGMLPSLRDVCSETRRTLLRQRLRKRGHFDRLSYRSTSGGSLARPPSADSIRLGGLSLAAISGPSPARRRRGGNGRATPRDRTAPARSPR